jgi:hypothetical protein
MYGPTMDRISRVAAISLVVIGLLVSATPAIALPPGGTFVDDDGNQHEGYIEAIAAAGITKGCNAPINDRYCPHDPVTRGQMAAFLSRALDLPSTSKDWFGDDNNSIFEDDINRLAAAGITKGCNPPANTEFCPNSVVSRAQMAAFLVRAYKLTSGGSTDAFIDDTGSVFETDINRLAAAGITQGCNPPVNNRYCPANPVHRDEMASFLGRAGDLSPTTPPPRVDLDDVDVNLYPGDDLREIVSSSPAGTVFLLHGVHHGQTIRPRDGQAFLGAGDAVMDGDGWVDAAFDSSARDVSVIGIEIRGYDSGDWTGAINGHGDDWLIEGCEIHDNRTAAIDIIGGSPTIRGNNIHHNGKLGLSINKTTGGLIENNEIAFNNYKDAFSWGNEAGASKFWETTDLVVRGNWSHDNHGPGFWADHDNIGILYEDNLIEDNYANGIYHEISYDAIIRNNVIRRNGFDHDAWLWGGGVMIASSQNVEIYGNVLEGNYNGIAMTQQDRGSGAYGPYVLRNNYAHDNTVIDSGLSGAAQDIGSDAIYHANIRFVNNTYVGDVGWHWQNSKVSWSTWQRYGQDTGGSYTP